MRNEIHRKKIKIILTLLGLVVGLLVLTFIGIEIFKRAKISNFEIKLNNLACTDEDQIRKHLQKESINYFSYKQETLLQNLKKDFFCIGNIKTRLSYPDKLFLEIWGRKAVFVISELQTSIGINPVINLPEATPEATESTKEAQISNLNQILNDIKQSSESGVFLVDRDGVIFEKSKKHLELPILSILGFPLGISAQIPNGVIEKAEFITSKFREFKIPTDNIIIIGDKLIVNSKPRIVFSIKKRLDYQTASLQLILNQSKINSDPVDSDRSSIESIDLRFNKPVVVYTSKK